MVCFAADLCAYDIAKILKVAVCIVVHRRSGRCVSCMEALVLFLQWSLARLWRAWRWCVKLKLLALKAASPGSL